MRAVARLSPENRGAIGQRLGSIGTVIPRTPREQRWFIALSITAGFCEELIYRGFVVWALMPWLGLYAAAAISVVLFGIGHAYQGWAGAVRATLTGAALGALALFAHSIVPGMILHAIIDLGSGQTAYTLLRGADPRPATA